MSFKFGKNGGKATGPVSHLIDIATDPGSQGAENWSLFMEICDVINSSEEGPKDAVKALRKRFSTKNSPVINLSLSLLETCVKNCGRRFHVQIATKDFLQDFIKIISPKHSPPIELQMKVLGLLQTWAHAFQSTPELKEVCKQYQELKNKGVEFPPLEVETANQTHIPAKSTPPVAAGVNTRMHSSHVAQPMCGTAPSMRPPGPAAAPGALTPDGLAKLHSELNTVEQNCRVFGEMLTELAPGKENRSDSELLEDLNSTCRQMQKRIMELIQVVQMENVTEELLRVNDELNNVFLRYDRYQRLRSGQPNPRDDIEPPPIYASVAAAPPAGVTPYPPAPSGVAVDNLIDLGDTPSPKPAVPQRSFETQFAAMSVFDGANLGGQPGHKDEFATFPTSAETTKQTAGPQSSQNVRDSDFAEMEKWLMENTGGEVSGEGATSSEFDRFLSERAKEADRLPKTTPSSGTAPTKKNDDASLFSL